MKNMTKLQIVCGEKFETAYQSIILHFEEHRSNLTWLKIKTMFLIFGFLDFPCKLKLFPMKIKVTNRDQWFCLWTHWFDFPMIFLKIIESWFDLIFWKINMILFDLILSIFICLTALFFLPLRKTTLIKTTQLHALLLES